MNVDYLESIRSTKLYQADTIEIDRWKEIEIKEAQRDFFTSASCLFWL